MWLSATHVYLLSAVITKSLKNDYMKRRHIKDKHRHILRITVYLMTGESSVRTAMACQGWITFSGNSERPS